MDFKLGDEFNPHKDSILHKELAKKFNQMLESLRDFNLNSVTKTDLRDRMLKILSYTANLHQHVASLNDYFTNQNVTIVMKTENSIPNASSTESQFKNPPFEKEFFLRER